MPDGAEGAQFPSARGAKPQVHHEPLQRLLEDNTYFCLIRTPDTNCEMPQAINSKPTQKKKTLTEELFLPEMRGAPRKQNAIPISTTKTVLRKYVEAVFW